MSAVHARLWRLRLAALMGTGAFAVHQLRFALAYGRDSHRELAGEGHAYLALAAPALLGLLLLALAGVIGAAVSGVRDPAPRTRRLWAGAAISLFAVYCVQELLEGMLSDGHPRGIAGVLGHGGWLALPLSVAIGLAIALLMRGATEVARLAERRTWWRTPAALAIARVLRPPVRRAARRTPLRVAPARAPPLAGLR